ncbi:ABC transporter substrate-binding protein [Phreatobacter stygius]|uniref:ABC transporter substrate-binding protein n=1 Tax=Phreatobacter stygius TaxID=1940610 RepID=A0A4D7B3T6_9HYPH|nr:ABC transporter substrate-binding protein [Phreatobacter stygius]QCI68449.1 ABC transporter substrate-binding protein [Phreatobacter stygius]
MIRHVVAGVAAAGLLIAASGGRAGELPAQVKQSGVIRISVNAIYPPMEYRDPATNRLVGLDIDLGEALAAKLGVRIEWSESAFEQLIPGLQTGRADLILSGLSDLPARRETMDFIDYLKSGAQFYTLAASPLATPEDVCGKRVGTSRSTSFPDQIRRWSAENCEAKGRPAITVVPAESTADARAQLKQGRIDAAVQGSETVPYAMSLDPGVFKPIGTSFTVNYQGIAFRKADTAFRDAIAEALVALIKDGTYQQILAKWNLPGNAVAGLIMNGEAR